MKFKSLPFWMFALGLLLILSGCVSIFIMDLKKDQATVLNRMGDVSNTFEEFSTEVSLYEEQRDLLYTEVLSNLYYDSLFVQDKIVKNRLSNYEAIVDEISKKNNTLDKLCSDVYYPDSVVNNKCSNYKSIYEQVVNYFVTDIKFYNKNITKYNEYVKNSGSTNTVSLYKTNKDYIDYNGDNVYDGKEE